MKWKTTLVLFVIAAGVFAYLFFVERNRPGTDEATRQAQNVVNFSRERVNGVVIQNGDDTIDIRRRDDKWRLEIPIKDQADGSVVNNLLLDLENWQKDAAISAKEMEADKNKLADYGLANPKLRLKLIGPDTPPEIFFGKDAALEGKMYVRFGNSKETFLASQSVKKAIDKKPEDFRDRKLTDLIMAQVVRVVLKTPAGELELQKKGDHWDIAKPLHTRAADQKISDLIAQVTTARIQQFVADDRGDLHPYGLAEPRSALTLFAQDDNQGQTLQIGGVPEKEKDQVYVRFSPRAFVYTLPKKIEEILNNKPNDLRDRHLVRIDTKILDRLTIDAPGKGKTVLARKDENWTIASRNNAPANSSEVRRLIDGLQNEQVAKFVEDVHRGLLDQVFPGPLQWQELSIFNFKPEQIHRVTVTTDKELALVRGANDQWSWAKGTGPINQTNVQSLLNTLSTLHAVRWIGSTTPAHAFDKPQLVVTFTTSPDDKAIHKLTIGGATPDGMWFAKVDEREGTFAIGNPDLNALKLTLVAQESPTPSPAATATATP